MKKTTILAATLVGVVLAGWLSSASAGTCRTTCNTYGNQTTCRTTCY